MKSAVRRKHALRQGFLIGVGTFILASIVGLGSQTVLRFFGPLYLKFLLLLLIILVGIVFDILGVAAAAATESPFHARGARKSFGSKQAVRIVRNADRFASFCNDVVGDISGTLSGAIGAAIVFEIASSPINVSDVVLGTLATALIAGLTVGGKASGKGMAIRHANDIVLKVGVVLAVVENATGIAIFGGGGKRGRRNGNGS